MAIKPRSNNRVSGPHTKFVLSHPTNKTDHRDEDTREIRSLCKESKPRYPVALDSDGIDMEEIEAIVSRMRNKANAVYHVNCKERCNIAKNELVSLWRQMLVNWMFYVVDCCKLQRHAVAAAAYFLDVAMLRELCQTREDHQLAAATALQMALKTFDTAVIKLDKLVKLGRGLFTEEDVAVMEMKIINSLNWNLHPPSLYCFVRQYEELTPSDMADSTRKIMDKVLTIIAEEMTLDEHYIKYCPSIQGLAAMMVAMDFIPDDCLQRSVRRTFASRLSTVTNVGGDSTVLFKVTKKIYKSLKKRDRVQDIIDITSMNTRGAQICQIVPLNDKNDSKIMQRESKSADEQHSPRDVKAKLRI